MFHKKLHNYEGDDYYQIHTSILNDIYIFLMKEAANIMYLGSTMNTIP